MLNTCNLANTSENNRYKLLTIREKFFRRLAALEHQINKKDNKLIKLGATRKMWTDWKHNRHQRQVSRGEENQLALHPPQEDNPV